MSSIPHPCINPNPDIAGVGVRVSIYIQALLSCFHVVWFLRDRKLSDDKKRVLDQIYTNQLLVACALLVSAYVQANTFGLSVYHALIVLNLGWINSVGAIGWISIDAFDNELDILDRWTCQKFAALLAKMPVILASTHLCLMSALGIWVWSTILVFGNQPECTPMIWATKIPLTNRRLRDGFIILYSVTAIPVINLIIPAIYFTMGSFGAVVPGGFGRRAQDAREVRLRFYFSALSAGAIWSILFVVHTELMVSKNAGKVKGGESQWTFGQILALLLVVFPPLLGLFNWIAGKKGDQGEEASAGTELNQR